MGGMGDSTTVALYLKQVLRPVVRLVLKHGLRLPEVLQTLRTVFVEVATDEIRRLNQKPSVSRLAVTTGMNRREVQRASIEQGSLDLTLSLPARVIGLWGNHPDFTSRQGRPRVLSAQGEASEFARLVRMVSQDVHPASVLLELERTGSIERTARGVQLVVEGYQPADPEDGIRMLSQDMEQLIFSVDENLFLSREEKNLHVRTVSSRIASVDAPVIRERLLREGGVFHRRVREVLAEYDLELNPRPGVKADAQVVVTSFGRLSETSGGGTGRKR